ncbi:MAG: hypothetical protein P8P29_04515 [Flavobacteriaceae bacterium]|nr:hypothetical protein [Flavobacteriaceae bacterium]
MTLREYYVYLFFQWVSTLSQVALMVAGAIMVWQTLGWFFAGSALFIVVMSTVVAWMDDNKLYDLAEEQERRHSSEEDL